MRYCPECQTITQEAESPTCPACGRVLLSKDEIAPEDLDRPVVLTWCGSVFEAMVLRAALADEGITAFVEDEGLLELINPYHGGPTVEGGTRVMIRLGDAEAGLEFLRRKEAGELAIPEDEIPGEADEEGKEEKEEKPGPSA